MAMPPALERAWHTHGYYGSVSHNVKAVYQRYLGWFDGNPARLWPHPPVDASARYVDCMGGADAVVARATEYADRGDLRFAAELLDRVVFADPDHTGAKETLAGVYERLAYGCENGTWRNFYLMGAEELRHGVAADAVSVGSPELLGALTVASCSMPSPSASTGPGRGTRPSWSTWRSPIWTRPIGSSCATGSSPTGWWGRGPPDPST